MLNIAIDGPSGAGKSTVAKIIAKKLGILYIDTGAMYRAVALKALDNNILPTDEKSVVPILKTTAVTLKHIGDTQHIFLDGVDVSDRIREHVVSKAASDISKIPAVRLKLVDLQREIASKNSVIMDGRDIGSYVLPNANKKFYLTASAEVRAKRRFEELIQKGQSVDFNTIFNDIIDRDKNDMTRSFAPLVQTEDAILIDSSNFSIEETTERILAFIKQ